MSCLVLWPASTASAQAKIDVDIELVLAVDISLSMDPDEQRLQRDGYIAALRDPNVLRAIRTGPHGKIAVTYVEWAGPDIQLHLIPWRMIDGPASAEAFIKELADKPYSRYRRTSISGALAYSAQLFGTDAYRGVRRVIDISGDGVNNSGPPMVPVREQILADGIIINGLPIVVRPTMGWNGYDMPGLELYYASCVIGGPGSFSIPITTPEEFKSATRQKLLLEISGITQMPRMIPVQMVPETGAGKYDCALVDRGLRRW